jgi:hypothetical protein
MANIKIFKHSKTEFTEGEGKREGEGLLNCYCKQLQTLGGCYELLQIDGVEAVREAAAWT